jgi:hypothetical protein
MKWIRHGRERHRKAETKCTNAECRKAQKQAQKDTKVDKEWHKDRLVKAKRHATKEDTKAEREMHKGRQARIDNRVRQGKAEMETGKCKKPNDKKFCGLF